MKIKYLLIGLVTSAAALLTSCGNSEGSEGTESKETSEVKGPTLCECVNIDKGSADSEMVEACEKMEEEWKVKFENASESEQDEMMAEFEECLGIDIENEVNDDYESSEDYDANSVQGQWDDIVFQVGTGDLKNLDMYVDYYAEGFSEEEWIYIDLNAPEYAEAFASYDSFEDLPEAEYFASGARVVQVYFETVEEGMTYESMTMSYLENRDGLLWIIGVEMAG